LVASAPAVRLATPRVGFAAFEEVLQRVDVRRDEHAFTLLELMVVMVVLGVLAGIIVFRLGPMQDVATASACQSDVRALATANAAYLAKHGADAPDIAALVSGGYIADAPSSGVTFANGSTNPASQPSGDADLALSDGATIAVTGLVGTTQGLGPTVWEATLTLAVRDDTGTPIDDVGVSGAWSDNALANGCTTDASGACTFSSQHANGPPRTWTLVALTKAGYATATSSLASIECKRPSCDPAQ
jgi:prepilin-type N-terminal cleavage/methylation domain-containing protein